MSQTYDVAIIGGGYAGLTCGITLAKEGYKVVVVEKNRTAGGAFQPFKRKGVQLDTGFHYVGGVGKGEIMNPLMRQFGIEDLPWVRMDSDWLHVFTHEKEYILCSGYERFTKVLGSCFPKDLKNLSEMARHVQTINAGLYKTVSIENNSLGNELMGIPAKKYFEERLDSPELRNLLCAHTLTTDLTDELPLYSFLQSLNSFIQGSYRLQGGGQVLIDRLVENLRSLGGELVTGRKIVKMEDDGEGNLAKITDDNGEEYKAEKYISTMHPRLTVDLFPDCPQVRNIYRRRFRNMPNSRGIFTVQLIMKPQSVKYVNHSISIMNSQDPWNPDLSRFDNMLINYNVPADGGEYVRNIDLLAHLDYEDLRQWEESSVGHRPAEYYAYKERRAQEAIALAKKYVPELEGNIEEYYTSTPLTYQCYTGTPEGSAYGVRKSANNLLGSVLSPLTPFGNMFLAGQSLILHGMLGVGMTTMLTCNIMTGKDLLKI